MKWVPGWLQYRAQAETATLWVREGDRWLGRVGRRIPVLERDARRAVHAQVQQAWTRIVG